MTETQNLELKVSIISFNPDNECRDLEFFLHCLENRQLQILILLCLCILCSTFFLVQSNGYDGKIHFYTYDGYGWGKRAFTPFCKSLGTGIAMGITFLEIGQANMGIMFIQLPITRSNPITTGKPENIFANKYKSYSSGKSSFALCIVLLLKKVLTHASCRLSNIRTR